MQNKLTTFATFRLFLAKFYSICSEEEMCFTDFELFEGTMANWKAFKLFFSIFFLLWLRYWNWQSSDGNFILDA